MASALMGEFLGTLFLVVLGCGVVANTLLTQSKGENAGWFGITAGWGMAVMVAVFVAQSAGSVQADINPAVTLAKFLLGIYSVEQMLWIQGMQVVGAFCGAALVWIIYGPHWAATVCPSKKLAVFATSPAIRSPWSNLLSEVLITTCLILGVGALFGSATGGAPVTGLGPYLVGMLVWGLGLSLGGPTGYPMNPARDLGPRLAHALLPISGKGSSDWGYAWVPIVGPLLGGALGAYLWKMVF